MKSLQKKKRENDWQLGDVYGQGDCIALHVHKTEKAYTPLKKRRENERRHVKNRKSPMCNNQKSII